MLRLGLSSHFPFSIFHFSVFIFAASELKIMNFHYNEATERRHKIPPIEWLHFRVVANVHGPFAFLFNYGERKSRL